MAVVTLVLRLGGIVVGVYVDVDWCWCDVESWLCWWGVVLVGDVGVGVLLSDVVAFTL